jgi:DNA-binding response OmpR family regulator
MAPPLNILVVEDHDLLRHATVGMLCENGHNAQGVFRAEDVDEGHSLALPDLYIIDLNLPGEDGISLAKRLRRARPGAGIVIVSARSDLGDRLTGYKTGADIYLTKPFDAEELLAVINSIALRIKGSEDEVSCKLDTVRLTLHGPEREVSLSQSEVRLLVGLSQARDQVLGHALAASHLRVGDDATSRANLNVRLSQLRKKMSLAGAEEPTIRAVRGHGYKLCLKLHLS